MNEIEVVVDGAISVLMITPELDGQLRRHFTFSNPVYYRMAAMGRDMRFSDIEEELCFATDTIDRGIIVPRGGVQLVKKAFAKAGVQIKWIDRRAVGERIEIPHPLQLPDGKPLKLRPFQKTALRMLRERVQGSAIVGCGGGKTVIGCAAIEFFARRALILVHTKDLRDQWVEELEEKLGITPGIIGEGDFRPGDVTIAMVQTMVNWVRDAQVESWLRTVGVCILDEAHHAPAEMFSKVLRSVPARVRLGLTATPKREDGLERVVDWCFGERLIEVPTKALLNMGYLMLPELEAVGTNFRFQSTTTDKFKRIVEIQSALEADEERAHMIASVMAFHAQQGEHCLLLANRKVYCRLLGKLLWTHGVKALVVTSDSTRTSRKRIMSDFRAGKARMVVATSLANEGLNAPGLSRIAYAWPEKAEGGVDQRTGRLMRLYDKHPKLIDFVDVHVPELVKRYVGRCRVYKRLGLIPPAAEEIEKEIEI